MLIITNSQEWLDELDDRNIEHMFNLYESIIGITQSGGFTCFQKKRTLYVQTDDHGKTLLLINGKAIKNFLDKLDTDYGGDHGWVGGYFHFVRNAGQDKYLDA